MRKAFLSKNKVKALSGVLFCIGLVLLFFIHAYWSAVVLVIGIPLALKQCLEKRLYDMAITLFIFIGFFLIAQFTIPWKILIPILFIMAAIYILCKEYVISKKEEEE